MKSALALVLGLSVVATSVGCDNAVTSDGAGGTGNGAGGKVVIPGAGSPSTSAGTSPGTGGASGGSTGSGGGTGGTGVATEGVPLTPTDGWVDVASNILGIQGAMFSYGDDTSKVGMTEDFTTSNACIKGTAAKVDTACTPVAPATDCYGTYWGAAIGLNLNQPIDATTMEGVETPLPFDATHLTGFSFTIKGSATGEMVPTTLRFKVEDAAAEYCTWKTIGLGPNTVLFSELETKCWEHAKMTGMSSVGAKSGLIKVAWQVVTNTGGTIPFDFCVSEVRAITDGTVMAGTGGTTGAGGTATGGTTATGGGGAATGGGGAATGGGGAAAGGTGGTGGSGGSGGG